MHDQRGRTSARFSRFSGAAFVPALLLLSTLSCAREPGILINIAAWPDGVERLRVRTNLEGTLGADFFVEKDQSRFAVRVPASSQGAVHIDVVGLDPMGCKLATGSLTELVPGNLSQFVERVLVLSPLSFHVCPFAPAMSFQVRAGLKSIAMGDFDGDLKLDLVVANATTNQISALLGDGMGGFSPPLPPSQPTSRSAPIYPRWALEISMETRSRTSWSQATAAPTSTCCWVMAWLDSALLPRAHFRSKAVRTQ